MARAKGVVWPVYVGVAIILYVLYLLVFGGRRPHPPPGAMVESQGGVPVLNLDGFGGKPLIDQLPVPDQPKSSSDTVIKQNLSDEERTLLRQVLPKMERVVHLDLKGAAPKVSYFEKIFPLMSQLGATGLLIEWEDMFPYKGDLADIAAENCYSEADVRRILELAAKSQLAVIPLIQSFGHMEFILKLSKYAHLREELGNPQVINPHLPESTKLIMEVVKQQFDMMPDLKKIHIGADEVWALGASKESIANMEQYGHTKDDLFLHHIRDISGRIRTEHPHTDILMWDDMFRKMPEPKIAKYGLNRLVVPVIWVYTKDVNLRVSNEVFAKYSKVFHTVWIASAFKGATGSTKFLTNIDNHYQNHISWLKIIASTEGSLLNIQGTMLTGWQRYDHFASLCELLPVGFPSLAVMLQTMKYAGLSPKRLENVNELLGCDKQYPIQWTINTKDSAWPHCTFPGHEVLEGAYQLKNAQFHYSFINDQSSMAGWRNTFHIRRNFLATFKMNYIGKRCNQTLDRLDASSTVMTTALFEVFGEETKVEWIESYIEPMRKDVVELLEMTKGAATHDAWPRRPIHEHVNENGLKKPLN